MKRVLLFAMVMCIFIFSGCTVKPSSLDSDESGTTVPIAPDDTSPTDPSNPDNAPVIYHSRKGKLTPESLEDTIVIYTDDPQSEAYATPVYMDSDINGKILSYDLGSWDRRVLMNGGGLFVADLDGNGTDEIVLFMEITGNGGSLAQVFEVKDNQISLLYDLNVFPVELTHTYQDGYQLLLENASVNFTQTIDVSKQFAPECFDENGRYTDKMDVFLKPVVYGSVDTVADDGLPTITYTRDMYLSGWLGTLQTTLRYDTDYQKMVVIAICFFEAESVLCSSDA